MEELMEMRALNALILLVVEAVCTVGSVALLAATAYFVFSP
jgi:hypothetical protein